MLTHASRVFLPISALAFVSALAYAVSTGDSLGITLLLFLTAVSAYAGISVAGHRDKTVVPAPAMAAISGDVMIDAGVGPQPGGGLWPMLMALAVALLVVSFVVGSLAAFAGLGLAAAAAVGWMAQSSAERLGREVNLLPLALPVVALAFIASLMFSMSRILLAVPEQGSTIVALVVAVTIFGSASLISLRPAIQTRALVALLAMGGVVMIVGGLVAAAAGERSIERPGEEAAAPTEGGAGPGGEAGAPIAAPISLTAKNISFDKAELDLPAVGQVRIAFSNQDKAVTHNVAIYTAEDAKTKVYAGQIVTGPGKAIYEFAAPPPGTYFFRCDVHPTMKGMVKVG